MPTVADAKLGRLLAVKRGTPLLHIDQVDYDAGGRAVMLSHEWHVADAFELIVNRRSSVGGVRCLSRSSTSCACATASATPRGSCSTPTTSCTSTSRSPSSGARPSGRGRTWSPEGVDAVVANASLRFRAPARYDDVVSCELRIVELGETSVSTEMRIMRDDTLLVVAVLEHVCVDAQTWKRTAFPDFVRDGLAQYVVAGESAADQSSVTRGA